MHPTRLALLVFVPVLGLAIPQEASGIITRHDVPDESYVVDGDDYPALVDLFEPGDCIGTLVTSVDLLTVAHCAEDLSSGASLAVSGSNHVVESVTLHPDWDGWDNDIAVVRLQEAVQGVTPYALYRGSDEQGELLTLVGRVIHATGLEGEPGGSTDGLLRRATNVVASVDVQWLEVLFEEPGGPDAITDLEGVGAGGDSGGPAFLETSDGLVIAGLNSWGEGAPGGQVGQYGASDYSTRVSRFADWIDSETSGDSPAGDGSDEPSDGSAASCSLGSPSASPGWLALLLGLGLLRRRTGTLHAR